MIRSWKPVLIGFGAGVFVSASGLALAAFFHQSAVERARMEAVAAASHAAPHRTVPFNQHPKIIAQAARDGIVVTVKNDSADNQFELCFGEDFLFVDFTGKSGPDEKGVTHGGGTRVIRLGPLTLAPGEAAQEIQIPLPRYWESARVWFEHQERQSNYQLTSKSGPTTVDRW